MSDLFEFLQAAASEVDRAQFERDLADGRLSMDEVLDRVTLLGNPESPLAVPFGVLSPEQFEEHFGNQPPDYDAGLPTPPVLDLRLRRLSRD